MKRYVRSSETDYITYRDCEIQHNSFYDGSVDNYRVWVDDYYRDFDILDDAYTYIDETFFDGDYMLGGRH